MPTTWTILGGLAVVCAVLIVILLVARLARRFRHEQRGFPVTPADEGMQEADVHPTRT
jgi:hypothetical protein